MLYIYRHQNNGNQSTNNRPTQTTECTTLAIYDATLNAVKVPTSKILDLYNRGFFRAMAKSTLEKRDIRKGQKLNRYTNTISIDDAISAMVTACYEITNTPFQPWGITFEYGYRFNGNQTALPVYNRPRTVISPKSQRARTNQLRTTYRDNSDLLYRAINQLFPYKDATMHTGYIGYANGGNCETDEQTEERWFDVTAWDRVNNDKDVFDTDLFRYIDNCIGNNDNRRDAFHMFIDGYSATRIARTLELSDTTISRYKHNFIDYIRSYSAPIERNEEFSINYAFKNRQDDSERCYNNYRTVAPWITADLSNTRSNIEQTGVCSIEPITASIPEHNVPNTRSIDISVLYDDYNKAVKQLAQANTEKWDITLVRQAESQLARVQDRIRIYVRQTDERAGRTDVRVKEYADLSNARSVKVEFPEWVKVHKNQ